MENSSSILVQNCYFRAITRLSRAYFTALRAATFRIQYAIFVADLIEAKRSRFIKEVIAAGIVSTAH